MAAGQAVYGVALLDLNLNTLEFAGRRIARYRPEIYQRNVFLPLAIDAPRFDSVALNYVLHCVPGSMRAKGEIFDHLKAVMNPGAVLFGSTLLYNRKGIFCNEIGSNWTPSQIFAPYTGISPYLSPYLCLYAGWL